MKKLLPTQAIYCFYLFLFSRLLFVIEPLFHRGIDQIAASRSWLSVFLVFDGHEMTLTAISLTALLVSLPFVHRQIVRFIFALFAFLIFGIDFGIDPGHPNHLLLWICLILAFIPGDLRNEPEPQRPRQMIRSAQLQILLVYGLSGVWKLYSVLKSFFDENIAAGTSYYPYSVASEFIHSGSVSPASSLLLQMPILATALSLIVVAFQVSCLGVAFFPRTFPIWGIVTALFHIGSLLGLGIVFQPAVIVALLFLTMTESEAVDS